jgi:chloramphenicol-sensitive protein RarD
MKSNKHYAAAISAFVIWGFFSIPLRALKDFAAGEILYFRILFSAVVLLFIVLSFKRAQWKHDWTHLISLSKKHRKEIIILTLAGGVLLSVNWLIFIYTINNVNIRTASFSYLICPVLTAVFAYFMLSERLTPLQWISVALCALSCVLIGLQSLVELGYSMLVAVSYALYLISQRRTQGFDRLIILCIQIVFSSLILSVFFTQLVNEIPSAGKFYSIILLISIVFTIVPLFLNLFALNRISSATIGILLYINPLLNFIIAFIVFHEAISPIQLFSYTVILIALILFNYQNLGKLAKKFA